MLLRRNPLEIFECQENPALGRWVSIQRYNYMIGKLEDERKRRLQELGFLWDARPLIGVCAIENTERASESVVPDVSDRGIVEETDEMSESDDDFPQHIVSDQGIRQETVEINKSDDCFPQNVVS
jgi:Helicase associated domain